MKSDSQILIETLIHKRCMVLLNEATAVANMSDQQLIDAHLQAQTNYYNQLNYVHNFQQSVANNARMIYDKNIDITRDWTAITDYKVEITDKNIDKYNKSKIKYNQKRNLNPGDPKYKELYQLGDFIPAKKKTSVYLKGDGKNWKGGNVSRDNFHKIMVALRDGTDVSFDSGRLKGKSFANDKIRQYFNISDQWGLTDDGKFRMSTTDNTCAAFTCTVLDITQSQMQTNPGTDQFTLNLNRKDDGREKKWSRNWTKEQWEAHLKNHANTMINTKTYMMSPEKIADAGADNTETWTTTRMEDFQKDIPENEKLDPYSAEFWQKYVRPGDMIIYHSPNEGPQYDKDESGASSHIAIAGHNTHQLYHDGSSKYTVKGQSDATNHLDYQTRGKKTYSAFTIIRYDNKTQIKQELDYKTQIENELANRNIQSNDVFVQNDSGQWVQNPNTVDPSGNQNSTLVINNPDKDEKSDEADNIHVNLDQNTPNEDPVEKETKNQTNQTANVNNKITPSQQLQQTSIPKKGPITKLRNLFRKKQNKT